MPQQPATDPNLRRRAFAGGPTSVDIATGSFDIIVSSPSPVVTWVPDPRVDLSGNIDKVDCSYIEVDEVLEPSGIDLSRSNRMPLLDSHDNYTTIDKILGKVENIRVEGDLVVARATLTRKRRDLIEDIAEGFYGQISASFTYDIRKDAEFIEREGQRPLVRVFRWLLLEASAVGVGADPRSIIRSYGQPPSGARAAVPTTPPTQEKTMELEELVKAAEDAVDAVVAATDEGASEEVVARAKAIRKLRGDGDEKPPEGTDAEGARAEGDALTAEEEKEADNIEESARSISKSLGDHIRNLRKFRAKPVALRAAAVAHLVPGVQSTPSSRSDKTPPVIEPVIASAPATIDYADIFTRANSRYRGGR